MNDDIHDKVQNFFSTYPQIRYPNGKILIFPGDSTDKIYHIVSGRVCQYTITYKGDEIIVNTFKSPAFFPMATAFTKEPSKFFYKTEDNTVMKVAPAADVLIFLRKSPDVAYNLLIRVYIGVDSVLERMVYLMSGTAKIRLIFELVIEFRRFGKNNGTSGYLEVSEASIASRSGLSRETVSREMKHLKDRGIVEVKPSKIFINNISDLEALLLPHA